MAGQRSEDFYLNSVAPSDIEKPLVASRSPSEEYYAGATAQGQRYHDKGQEIMEKMGAERAKGIKEYYAPITETIKNLVPSYYKGREMSDQAEENRLRIRQAERGERRDEAYGDEMAKTNLAQNKAGVSSTEAGTEATRQSTERSKQMTPIELEQAKKNVGMMDLNKQQLTGAIKAQNLQNETAENQQKYATIAAIINNKKAQAPNTPQDQMAAEQAAVADLRAKGIYDDVTLNKGQSLAKSEAFQNAYMAQNILNSDPKYAEAQTIHQKATAAVTAFNAIKSEMGNIERDTSIIDSPQFKQGIENIKRQLNEAGQTELAASLDRGFAAAMARGEPAFKAERAKAALAALSNTIRNQIAGYAQQSMINPHIDTNKLNQLAQTVYYNQNMPSGQTDLFQKARGSGPYGMPASAPQQQPPISFAPGAVPPQQQQPPVDLRGSPGANMNNPKPQQGTR